MRKTTTDLVVLEGWTQDFLLWRFLWQQRHVTYFFLGKHFPGGCGMRQSGRSGLMEKNRLRRMRFCRLLFLQRLCFPQLSLWTLQFCVLMRRWICSLCVLKMIINRRLHRQVGWLSSLRCWKRGDTVLKAVLTFTAVTVNNILPLSNERQCLVNLYVQLWNNI